MEAEIAGGGFLEYAEVHGNLYDTSPRALVLVPAKRTCSSAGTQTARHTQTCSAWLLHASCDRPTWPTRPANFEPRTCYCPAGCCFGAARLLLLCRIGRHGLVPDMLGNQVSTMAVLSFAMRSTETNGVRAWATSDMLGNQVSTMEVLSFAMQKASYLCMRP